MAGLKTRDLVYSSLGVTLLIISSYIYVPLPFTPVPGTLQTLVVILVALSFKPKISRMAIAVFLFLGSIGFPVFSGGRGGAGAILGPTGGFIMGFAVAVFLISAFRSRINSFMKAVVYSSSFWKCTNLPSRSFIPGNKQEPDPNSGNCRRGSSLHTPRPVQDSRCRCNLVKAC